MPTRKELKANYDNFHGRRPHPKRSMQTLMIGGVNGESRVRPRPTDAKLLGFGRQSDFSAVSTLEMSSHTQLDEAFRAYEAGKLKLLDEIDVICIAANSSQNHGVNLLLASGTTKLGETHQGSPAQTRGTTSVHTSCSMTSGHSGRRFPVVYAACALWFHTLTLPASSRVARRLWSGKEAPSIAKGACKLAGEPKYNHKSALSSVEGSPCTNVPMLCPLCPQKPGVAVYKYDMEKHWRAGHSEATITPAMKESVSISAAERRWLKGRWEKAKAAAKRITARGK